MSTSAEKSENDMRMPEEKEFLLILHLAENQPSIVPTSVALRIIAHSPFRIVQGVTAEWVVSCESA